jgi:hypothetical protein
LISLTAEPAAFNAATRALGIMAKGHPDVKDEIGKMGVIKLLVQSVRGAGKEVGIAHPGSLPQTSLHASLSSFSCP